MLEQTVYPRRSAENREDYAFSTSTRLLATPRANGDRALARSLRRVHSRPLRYASALTCDVIVPADSGPDARYHSGVLVQSIQVNSSVSQPLAM